MSQTPLSPKSQLIQAHSFFQSSNYAQSQSLYKQLLINPLSTPQQKCTSLQNLASLYLSTQRYKQCVQTIQLYLSSAKQVPPEIYVMQVTGLVKIGDLEGARAVSRQGTSLYPYHKKLQQLSKVVQQKQMVESQQNYVQRIFEKLCLHPKIRQYLKQESFLTKIERVIRNPSLAAVMAKIDPRVLEATQFILMAQEEEEEEEEEKDH